MFIDVWVTVRERSSRDHTPDTTHGTAIYAYIDPSNQLQCRHIRHTWSVWVPRHFMYGLFADQARAGAGSTDRHGLAVPWSVVII